MISLKMLACFAVAMGCADLIMALMELMTLKQSRHFLCLLEDQTHMCCMNIQTVLPQLHKHKHCQVKNHIISVDFMKAGLLRMSAGLDKK